MATPQPLFPEAGGSEDPPIVWSSRDITSDEKRMAEHWLDTTAPEAWSIKLFVPVILLGIISWLLIHAILMLALPPSRAAGWAAVSLGGVCFLGMLISLVLRQRAWYETSQKNREIQQKIRSDLQRGRVSSLRVRPIDAVCIVCSNTYEVFFFKVGERKVLFVDMYVMRTDADLPNTDFELSFLEESRFPVGGICYGRKVKCTRLQRSELKDLPYSNFDVLDMDWQALSR